MCSSLERLWYRMDVRGGWPRKLVGWLVPGTNIHCALAQKPMAINDIMSDEWNETVAPRSCKQHGGC